MNARSVAGPTVTVGVQADAALEAAHGRFGVGTEEPVDPARVEAEAEQSFLQLGDVVAADQVARGVPQQPVAELPAWPRRARRRSSGPTMPSTSRPRSCWNERTAASSSSSKTSVFPLTAPLTAPLTPRCPPRS